MASSKRRRRSSPDLRWYASEKQPHEAIHAATQKLLRDDRRDRLLLWRALYLDEDGYDYSRHRMYRPGMRMRFNLIRSVVETLLARIGKSQPDPMVVTVGGDWKTQRKAKAMERYLKGEFERLDYANLSEAGTGMRVMTLLDALIFGTGCIKVYPHHGRVAWQRTFRANILVDRREECANAIRTLYEVRAVDREVLRDMFPEEKDAIDNLPTVDLKEFPGEAETDDLVQVTEAWHLPVRPRKKGEDPDYVPGRHAIVTKDGTLYDEDWERDGFPFAWLHATRDPLRLFSIGYPERMAGQQSEQNIISEAVSDGVRLFAPKILAQVGAGLTMSDDWTNEVGEVWEYSSPNPPTILAPPPAAPELIMHAQTQRREILEDAGVSPMSAHSQKPQGLNSGKAMLVHEDIESERHAMLGRAKDRLTIQLGQLHIQTCEQIVREDGGADLIAYDGKTILDAIRYTDCSLGENYYEIRVYPVSALASSPQGKLQQLQEMMQSGMITPAQARRLYDFPDLDRDNAVELAREDIAQKVLDAALDGKVIPPNPYMDLEYLVRQGWKLHALAQLQGADPDTDLVVLTDVIGAAQELLAKQAAEAQKKAAEMQAAAAPPPMPGGPPMPPDGAPAPAGPLGVVPDV